MNRLAWTLAFFACGTIACAADAPAPHASVSTIPPGHEEEFALYRRAYDRYGQRVEGTVGDVQTNEATFGAYRVERSCTRALVAVKGLGAKPLADLPQETLRIAAIHELRSLESMHGSGFVATCHDRIDARPTAIVLDVTLADYREVDEAIRLLGAWMTRENWRGEVDLDVGAIGEAL